MLLDSQAGGGQGAGRGGGDTQLGEHHDWGGHGVGGGGDTHKGEHCDWEGQAAGGGEDPHPGEHHDLGGQEVVGGNTHKESPQYPDSSVYV